jgi:hypothetical protein
MSLTREKFSQFWPNKATYISCLKSPSKAFIWKKEAKIPLF